MWVLTWLPRAMEREERSLKGLHSSVFLESAFAGGQRLHESVAMLFFFPPLLKLVSCFPPGPHLFSYLPHHLLLLFIVYLPNEGGGVDWGLIDSYKPLQSGQRAVGFGFKSALNVRLGPVFIKPNCCSS